MMRSRLHQKLFGEKEGAKDFDQRMAELQRKLAVSVHTYSILQSPMVRRSGSKLMPTFTMGSPERENLEA